MLELPLQLVTGALRGKTPVSQLPALVRHKGFISQPQKNDLPPAAQTMGSQEPLPLGFNTSAEIYLGGERRGSWQKERKKPKFSGVWYFLVLHKGEWLCYKTHRGLILEIEA